MLSSITRNQLHTKRFHCACASYRLKFSPKESVPSSLMKTLPPSLKTLRRSSKTSLTPNASVSSSVSQSGAHARAHCLNFARFPSKRGKLSRRTKLPTSPRGSYARNLQSLPTSSLSITTDDKRIHHLGMLNWCTAKLSAPTKHQPIHHAIDIQSSLTIPSSHTA